MSRIINKRCEVCDKVIKYRTYWKRHCQTKKHLRNLEVIQKRSSRDPKEIQKRSSRDPKEIQERSSRDPVDNNIDMLQCKYCNKQFKHKTNKYRHENHRCDSKPLETQVQVINNNTNNTNSNNTNNTLNQNQTTNNNQITLNVYGEETIPRNFLTNDLFEKLKLCEGDLSKTYLLLNDELYLKNKKNDNIKYTNIQSEYCQILSKDNDWILKRLLEVMNERGIVVKNELEKELERIIEEEGIKNNRIIVDPKMKQLQIMYMPMSKFQDNINEEDEEMKELYKKYQLELYNLKKKRKKRIERIIEI
jgi:hypothetical protein